jgi:xanthine dehydrogenase accessory factor
VIYQNLRQSLITGKLVAVATVIAGPGLGRKLLFYPTGERFGSLGSLDDWIQHQANQLMSQQQSGRFSCSLADEAIELFVDVYPPRAKLIMVGAVHIAIPLTTFAKALGFLYDGGRCSKFVCH